MAAGLLVMVMQSKGLIYTFLSSKNRRTWIHHYTGTYGTIIINEGINIIDNNKEIENILSSKILRKRPLLLVYDKNKKEKNLNFQYLFIHPIQSI